MPMTDRLQDKLIIVFFIVLIVISFIPLIPGCASFAKPLYVSYGSYTILSSADHNGDHHNDDDLGNDLHDIGKVSIVPTIDPQPTIEPSTIPSATNAPTDTPTPSQEATITPTPSQEAPVIPTPPSSATYPISIMTVYGTPTPDPHSTVPVSVTPLPVSITPLPMPVITANKTIANDTAENTAYSSIFDNDAVVPPVQSRAGSANLLLLANLLMPLVAAVVLLYSRLWSKGK